MLFEKGRAKALSGDCRCSMLTLMGGSFDSGGREGASRRWLALGLPMVLLFGACEQAPAEPAPRKTAVVAAKVPPLQWTVPPTWTVERTAKDGRYRGKYRSPAAGADKHGAELLVSRLSSPSKLPTERKLFVKLFKQGPKTAPVRVGKKAAGVGAEVEVVEVSGTYRHPMGPAIGPQKRHAAHQLKENWRGLLATVDAKARGAWVFRLIGPDDSVKAARSAFINLVENLR